jgi:hypothetical protein
VRIAALYINAQSILELFVVRYVQILDRLCESAIAPALSEAYPNPP